MCECVRASVCVCVRVCECVCECCLCRCGPSSAPSHPLREQLLPQLDPSCEANRAKDEGERVPADPPGLMKIHLLSRDKRLVNQVHFTTDYILWNKYKNELEMVLIKL